MIDKILSFVKWFFESIFKLSALKMLIVLGFILAGAYLYFNYDEIMSEKVTIKSVENPITDYNGKELSK